MQWQFHRRLREPEQHLVDRIEARMGFEVLVRVDEAILDATMRIEMTEDSTSLVVRSPDDFTPGGAFHELSHAELFYLRGVPHLIVCEERWSEEAEQTVTIIDNGLEHLIIVPIEIQQFPERRDRWVGVLLRLCDQIALMAAQGRANVRTEALFACLEISLLNLSPVLAQRARQLLLGLDLTDEAADLVSRVRAGAFDKITIAETVFTFFDLDLSQFCLESIDPVSRAPILRPMQARAA